MNILSGIKYFIAVVVVSSVLGEAKADDQSSLQDMLPRGAHVLETKDISKISGRPRVLVLWMSESASQYSVDHQLYCGSFVYGSGWHGRAHLSAVDFKRRKLISSVDIQGETEDGDPAPEIAIPVSLPVGDATFKKANILNLKDYTGEGKEAQFPLFDYVVCGHNNSTLLGYEADTDQVLQYRINEKQWAPEIFDHSMIKPGYWDFEWGFGHGSDASYREIVHFVRKSRQFVTKTETLVCDDGSKPPCR